MRAGRIEKNSADAMTGDQQETGPQRLQKLLARAGFGSRRECEDLIARGRVRLDGRVAILGDRADPVSQLVEVDTVAVRFDIETVVYLLYKPRNVLTTVSDSRGRATVMTYVPAEPRVFPVGRLDRDTEGLLLLTNEGDFAQKVMHPSHSLPKTYVAVVDGVISDHTLSRLRRGVKLEEGLLVPRSVRILARRKASTLVEIRLGVGWNRVVRRVLEEVGHPVRRLTRTAIGDLSDTRLGPGEFRRLTTLEIAILEGCADVEGVGMGRRSSRAKPAHGRGATTDAQGQSDRKNRVFQEGKDRRQVGRKKTAGKVGERKKGEKPFRKRQGR